jgi:hypothetical protein
LSVDKDNNAVKAGDINIAIIPPSPAEFKTVTMPGSGNRNRNGDDDGVSGRGGLEGSLESKQQVPLKSSSTDPEHKQHVFAEVVLNGERNKESQSSPSDSTSPESSPEHQQTTSESDGTISVVESGGASSNKDESSTDMSGKKHKKRISSEDKKTSEDSVTSTGKRHLWGERGLKLKMPKRPSDDDDDGVRVEEDAERNVDNLRVSKKVSVSRCGKEGFNTETFSSSLRFVSNNNNDITMIMMIFFFLWPG